ncbi:subtilisin-like protease SBT6.1 isoform X1 [Zingiber officinale]|uniref:subtilisin-like protease SBT6.1 isoform X1 n=1 Tax=Zingiber officinale TaxID=94328 RepID=UPI001C4BDEBB|nr:subtilisin-like protease SBT6.1 isoform X1 [Zingiber officinale]
MADRSGRRLASAFLPPLFLALIHLSLWHPVSDLSTSLHGSSETTAAPTRNHVVRFLEYRMAEDHRAYLEEKLGSRSGWRWVERRNPAALFPTDFGVMEIEESGRASMVLELRMLGRVKDVYVDTSYSRSLFVQESRKGGRGLDESKKRPGKIFTSMSFEEETEVYSPFSNASISWRRTLMMMQQRSQVTSLFGADRLWSKGFTGKKVKMAIFDTGIRADHPHFRNIKERTNWTNEDTLNDNLGHGTFVAGVIASEDAECLGFAPDTEIYAFRVFTDAQVSYTSWFLDAFNYAIATNMDVLNLSIGGPDFLDLPFVEKVWELTANNIIMVSAIGNDGPLYGTLNNPADQSDVIGVGGIDYNDHIASFSSRGMSTWEIPHGYGRVKPDVVAYGRDIMGSKISTGCKSLSGTSVASPVVAGIVCLLVSIIPESMRKTILNPATMKQALVEGATKLSGPNMYEQGAGRINLWESYQILENYQPRASIFPSVLDYTDCPYSWPFCRQPLYAGAMPVIFNATILNGMGVIGYIESPPIWNPSDDVGNLLSIHFTYSDIIWPWTGYLALHMQIKDEGYQYSGLIEGNVTLTVYSPSSNGEEVHQSSTCVLHLKLKVVETPPRSRRILWDQYHNIKYPPGYIPRDSLDVRNDILDWHGDHLHTNFHIMYNMLRDAGYYVETLGSPFTCFDASHYGTLLMVDLEDEYYKDEIEKLRDDVLNEGLGIAVFAEWYNVDSMVKMRFFDDNTRSWWTPVTGGANIPALNELLAPFDIAFGDKILNGDFSINGEQSHYASGTDIVMFPKGGYLHSFEFQDNSEASATQNILSSGMTKVFPILGLVEVGKGRIAVYGDSNCLDGSHMVTNCYWLLRKFLDFTSRNIKDPVLFSDSSKTNKPLHVDKSQLPVRRTDVNFSSYSSVVGKDLICHRDTRFEFWGTRGYGIHQHIGRNRKLPVYQPIDMASDANTTMGLNLKSDEFTIQDSSRNHSEVIDRNKSRTSIDFLGLLNRDEVDVPMLMAGQWMIPLLVALTCFLLYLSWRMRQRRRRRRKGSVSGRLMNMV